jgi:hypothetical protein
MILKHFRASAASRSIRDLYGVIVAQARSAAFYTDYGVPDTVLGRFDLIVLHLVLARLDGDGSSARGIGQKLFDLFCPDLDANLREMGVGDLAVAKADAELWRSILRQTGRLSRRTSGSQPPRRSLRRRWRAISFME